jgi:hypothetical protein
MLVYSLPLNLIWFGGDGDPTGWRKEKKIK